MGLGGGATKYPYTLQNLPTPYKISLPPGLAGDIFRALPNLGTVCVKNHHLSPKRPK